MDHTVLTLDIDWAPDCAIDWIAGHLVDHEVRATWFVTHLSPAVARLREHTELFELGIHPNFLAGSTHGDTPEAVLDHCMRLVPDASSMRSHALVQSTPILNHVLTATPITTDVSLFLPYTPNLCPVEYRVGDEVLLRLPYFWEDDDEMQQPEPCWQLRPLLGVEPGLRIFDFHPIHVFMNGADMTRYRRLTADAVRLQDLCEADVDGLMREGAGTRSLFLELVEHLAGSGRSLRVRDVAAEYTAPTAGARH